MKILIIGDSFGLPNMPSHITEYSKELEIFFKDTYPNKLRQMLNNTYPQMEIEIINCCKYLNTTYDLFYYAQKIVYYQPEWIIFQIGIVDCWTRTPHHKPRFKEMEGKNPWVSEEEYIYNFYRIIEYCFKYTSVQNIVLVNISKTSQQQYDKHQGSYERTLKYNNSLGKIVKQFPNVHIADIFQRFELVDGILFSDGIHPNEKVAELIADEIFKIIHCICKKQEEKVSVIMLPDLLERNKIFRDCHKGKRCFIIGNGPSLKTQDLSPLGNEITFVVSFFYKHSIIEKWQPKYHFLADPAFFDGTEPFLESEHKISIAEFFNQLRTKLYSTSFFVPIWGAKKIVENGFLPFERTYFVPFQGLLSKGVSELPDFTKAVPGVQSVSQIAIMAAIYMGCSPIYLLGLDHNWLANWGHDPHFYGTSAMIPDKIPSFKSELEANLSLWYGYEHLLNLTTTRGIKILNATKGGLLDVFERVDYESLFEKKALVKEDEIKPQSPYPPNISTEQILQQRAVQLANQASPLVSQGKYADAIKLLDEAMYHCPRIENLQYLRAICLWNLGRFDEAKIAAVAEIRTFPKNQVVKDVFSHILPEWEYSSDGWRIKNSVAQP